MKNRNHLGKLTFTKIFNIDDLKELDCKDVRLGNLVYSLSDNEKILEVVVVGRLNHDEIFYEECDFDGTIGCSAFAIPLTEEWLIKLGFIKKDEGYGILTSMKQAVLISFGNHNCSINGLSFNNPTKYVHQLQNLFFALIGEELELK